MWTLAKHGHFIHLTKSWCGDIIWDWWTQEMMIIPIGATTCQRQILISNIGKVGAPALVVYVKRLIKTCMPLHTRSVGSSIQCSGSGSACIRGSVTTGVSCLSGESGTASGGRNGPVISGVEMWISSLFTVWVSLNCISSGLRCGCTEDNSICRKHQYRVATL